MSKMNLCPDCQHEISKSAKSCPNCGKKNPNKHIGFWGGVFIIFGILFVIGLITSGDKSSSSNNSSSPSPSSSYTPSNNSIPTKQWNSHAYITDLENEKRAYVKSNNVDSDKDLDFPYQGTTASISVVKNKNKTWAYIEFSTAPNIVGDQTENGYNIIKADVYIDGVRETATLTQEWGSKTLFFEYSTWLINKLKTCNTFRINLRWHGNPNAVWSFYPRENFNTEYESMLNKFNNL